MDGNEWDCKRLIINLGMHVGEFGFPPQGVEHYMDALTDQGKLLRLEDMACAGHLLPGVKDMYAENVRWVRNPEYREAADGGLGRSFV